MSARRYALLDRDGTIIVDREYLSDPADVELLPNAAHGLRQCRDLGLGLILITNQSGIARGLFTEAAMAATHNRVHDILRGEGVLLDGIYVCPHAPIDQCCCRKPAPGLVQQAARELEFSPSDCFVIGDKPCDVELGKGIGAMTIQIRCDTSPIPALPIADYVAQDLLEAANYITQHLQANNSWGDSCTLPRGLSNP